MATRQEIEAEVGDAQLAVARLITGFATKGGSADQIRALAEAFAWLTSPGQAH